MTYRNIILLSLAALMLWSGLQFYVTYRDLSYMPWFPTWLTHLTFSLPLYNLPPAIWNAFPTFAHGIASTFLLATSLRVSIAASLAGTANAAWEWHQRFSPDDLPAAVIAALTAYFCISFIDRFLLPKLGSWLGRKHERLEASLG